MAEADRILGTEPFGALLRRHRVAVALSQEALAERAGLSTRAVSDLERGVKTRPHLETVRLLADALGLDAAQRAALAAAARPSETPPARVIPVAGPSDVAGSGLRIPPTPLVGREREFSAVAGLLRQGETRLVTLTGPGGVGKTRLAQAIAETLTGSFPDGVAWVELAPLADPALVPGAVVRAVGLREEPGGALDEALRAFLRGRRMLLILDNCEHLRRAVGTLAADLHRTCPDLVMLSTSRAPLRLAAEQVYPLGSLGLPTPAASGEVAMVAETAAVRLFVQRAQAVRPGFGLDAQNSADVAEICRRLDGLPLAIELAAARTRVLSPSALRALLEERLRLLTGGPEDAPARQRTLSATIAWSHDLLASAEQTLFRRLAVFAGGGSLEGAAAVATDGDPFAALDGLEALVDQSLVRRVDGPADEPRFVMLETIRAFAAERLTASGEEETIRWRHATYFLTVAEATESGQAGPDAHALMDRLDADHPNLRSALAWAVERREAELSVRLCGALWRFWWVRGHVGDARELMTRALAFREEVPAALQAKMLDGAGVLAHEQGDLEHAAAFLTTALSLWQQAGDRPGIARSLNALGHLTHDQGDYDRATTLFEDALSYYRETRYTPGIADSVSGLAGVMMSRGLLDRAATLIEESATLFREMDDSRGEGIALTSLGSLALMQERYAEAMAFFESSLARWRDLDDPQGLAIALQNLGSASYLRGDLDAARGYYDEALPLFRDVEDQLGIATTLCHVGEMVLAQGDVVPAAMLFRESLALFEDMGAQSGVIESLECMAAAARTWDEPALSARLFGATEALREATEAPLLGAYRAERERKVEATRAAMREEAFAEAWMVGRSLSLEQAIADAKDLTVLKDRERHGTQNDQRLTS